MCTYQEKSTKKTCTRMFVDSLFLIAIIENNPSTSTKECLKICDVFIQWNITQRWKGINYYTREYGWISKTLSWIKKVRHWRVYPIWVHSHAVLEPKKKKKKSIIPEGSRWFPGVRVEIWPVGSGVLRTGVIYPGYR